MPTDSEVKKKRRSQAERRGEAESRLVQAAWSLLAKNGYDGFTLADVGEAAGYSRGLPAHYFGRKEDLLALVAQQVVDAYRQGATDPSSEEPGFPRIAAGVRDYVRPRDHRGIRALSLLIAESMVRPELKRAIANLNIQGLFHLKSELDAGIRQGNIRPDTDTTLQAKLIYSFLRGQMSFAILEPDFDTVAVGEEFISTLEARLVPATTKKRNARRAASGKVST